MSIFPTPADYWNIYDVYETQAKRLYFCASNKYDFLDGGAERRTGHRNW